MTMTFSLAPVVDRLWDDDAMVAMDDDEDDDSELANFKVTKISMV